MERIALRQKFQTVIEQSVQKGNDKDDEKNCGNFSAFAKFILKNRLEFRKSFEEGAEILMDLVKLMKQHSNDELFNFKNIEVCLFPCLDTIRFCFSFCNEFNESEEENYELCSKISRLYATTTDFMLFLSTNLVKMSDMKFISENDVRIWSSFVEKSSQIISLFYEFGENKVVLSSIKSFVQFLNVSRLSENLKDRLNFDSVVTLLCEIVRKLLENIVQIELDNSNLPNLENQSKMIYVALKILANLVESLSGYLGSVNADTILKTIQSVLTKVLEKNLEKLPKVLNLVEYFTIPIEPLIGFLLTEREILPLALNLSSNSSASLIILVIVLDNLSKEESGENVGAVIEKIFEMFKFCSIDIFGKLPFTFGKNSLSLYDFCYQRICKHIICTSAVSFPITERIIWNNILDSSWAVRNLASDCMLFTARYAKKDLCSDYCNNLGSILNDCRLDSSKEIEHLGWIFHRLVKCLTKIQQDALVKSEFFSNHLNVTVSYFPFNCLAEDLLAKVIEKLTNLLTDNVSSEQFLLALKCLGNINFEKLSSDQISKILIKINKFWKFFPDQSKENCVFEIRCNLFKISSNLLVKVKDDSLIFKLLEVAIVPDLLPQEEVIVSEILARLSSFKPSDEKKKDIFNRCVVHLFRRSLASPNLLVFNAALKNFNFFARNTTDAKILTICVPEKVRAEVLHFVETNFFALLNDVEENALLKSFF